MSRPEQFYVGRLQADGSILACAGPFERAWEASEARTELVGRERKYTLPLIVHRAPRPVRMVSLREFLETKP